jgi:hypothetical protein
VVVHGIAYQVIEDRKAGYVVLLAVMAGLAIMLQLAGVRGRRSAGRAS